MFWRRKKKKNVAREKNLSVQLLKAIEKRDEDAIALIRAKLDAEQFPRIYEIQKSYYLKD